MKRTVTALLVCALASYAAAQTDVSAPNVSADDDSVSVGTTATNAPKPRDVQTDQTINEDLHVAGNLTLGGTSTLGFRLFAKGTAWFENSSTDHAIRISPGTTGGYHLIDANYSSSGGFLPITITANPSSFLNQLHLGTTGNVGIGTTASTNKLTVAAADHGDGVAVTGVQSPGFMLLATPASPNDRNWGIYANYSAHGDLVVNRSIDSTSNPYAGPTALSLQSNGNVGIATTAPTKRLTVVASDNGDGVAVTGVQSPGFVLLATPSSPNDGNWGIYANYAVRGDLVVNRSLDSTGNPYNGPTALSLQSNGNVGITDRLGIGTISPTNRLHIAGTGTDSVSPTIRVQNTTTGAINTAAISLERGDFNGYAQAHYMTGATPLWSVGLRAPDNDYHIRYDPAYADRLTITASGNVGIGTPTPAKTLHVAGDIQVDGNINAKFQDLAEWVPATEAIEPGMIVVIAPANNHVSASREAYDTRVAGVVSLQPGVVLGEAGDSKVMVATTGRVKVRVDTSNGPIRPGDILVSGPIKGTAMKSEPLVVNGRTLHQPGTVIGKALEPLQSGIGEILVLLSLQ